MKNSKIHVKVVHITSTNLVVLSGLRGGHDLGVDLVSLHEEYLGADVEKRVPADLGEDLDEHGVHAALHAHARGGGGQPVVCVCVFLLWWGFLGVLGGIFVGIEGCLCW